MKNEKIDGFDLTIEEAFDEFTKEQKKESSTTEDLLNKIVDKSSGLKDLMDSKNPQNKQKKSDNIFDVQINDEMFEKYLTKLIQKILKDELRKRGL